MSAIEAAFSTLFPPAEELWQRGGATLRPDGVPDFGIDIRSVDREAREKLYDQRGQRIGEAVTRRLVTSDGIDRLVRVYLPDHKHRSDTDLTVTDGTAWTTTINGYAAKRNARIVEATGIPLIHIGAEHSGGTLGVFDGLRLPATLGRAATISLAKTAQSEERIIGELAERYGLSRHQYIIGDSRASMKSPAQYAYARENNLEIDFSDTKAPCVPQRIHAKDVPRFFKWAGVEMTGGSLIVAKMILDGEFSTLVGTPATNPNEIATALIGVMPALADGEAGRAINWVPRDAAGHVVVYGHDRMSFHEKWRELWASHPNVVVKSVRRGIHASLLSETAQQTQIDRIRRFSKTAPGERAA